MQIRLILQWTTILVFFIIALVMELAPWPTGFQVFKPAWLILVLTYWILAIPNKVSIGVAFLLGVIWDLLLGSTLGIHALVPCRIISTRRRLQLARNLRRRRFRHIMAVGIFAYAKNPSKSEITLIDTKF